MSAEEEEGVGINFDLFGDRKKRKKESEKKEDEEKKERVRV